MLYDPSRDKPPPSSPSLFGFSTFVAMRMLAEGADGEYEWPNPNRCAVAQYLEAIGAIHTCCWYDRRSPVLMHLDTIAEGPAPKLPRDARGRFTNGPYVVDEKQWTWGALFERIRAECNERFHYVEVHEAA